MSVKSAFTFFKNLNARYLYFALACLFIAVSIQIIQIPNRKFLGEQAHLAMRAIGDELLKTNGDFNTPVPPIQRIDSETLRLTFDQPIVIDPDTLVLLSLHYLDSDIVQKSIVSVRDAMTEEVVYGFEIDHAEEKEIPCLGRTLPQSNYLVEVSFYHDQKSQLFYANIPALGTSGASLLFACFGLLFLKKRNPEVNQGNEMIWNGIKLDIERNSIIANQERIRLTDKETQILAILFEQVGNLVSREFFIQEVWLKNGVVTDRSLDMYISRLRKKLGAIPNVQIANQHGKGYYLKMN